MLSKRFLAAVAAYSIILSLAIPTIQPDNAALSLSNTTERNFPSLVRRADEDDPPDIRNKGMGVDRGDGRNVKNLRLGQSSREHRRVASQSTAPSTPHHSGGIFSLTSPASNVATQASSYPSEFSDMDISSVEEIVHPPASSGHGSGGVGPSQPPQHYGPVQYSAWDMPAMPPMSATSGGRPSTHETGPAGPPSEDLMSPFHSPRSSERPGTMSSGPSGLGFSPMHSPTSHTRSRYPPLSPSAFSGGPYSSLGVASDPHTHGGGPSSPVPSSEFGAPRRSSTVGSGFDAEHVIAEPPRAHISSSRSRRDQQPRDQRPRRTSSVSSTTGRSHRNPSAPHDSSSGQRTSRRPSRSGDDHPSTSHRHAQQPAQQLFLEQPSQQAAMTYSAQDAARALAHHEEPPPSPKPRICC